MRSQPEGKPDELTWHINALPRLIVAITEGALVGGMLYWAWNQGAADKPKGKTVTITQPDGTVKKVPLIAADYDVVEQVRMNKPTLPEEYYGQTAPEREVQANRLEMQSTGQLGAQGQASPAYLAMNEAAKDVRIAERGSLGGGGTTAVNVPGAQASAGFVAVPTVYWVSRGGNRVIG